MHNETQSILNIVGTECRPESDAKFNKWYNEVHIPLIMEYNGLKKAERYRKLDPKTDTPTYLAFYFYDAREDMDNAFKSPEFGAALKDMQDTWKAKETEAKWVVSYEKIRSWDKDKSAAELPVINIVATECRPDVEEKFNKWYNDTHIPFFLKYNGLKKVVRYKKFGPNTDLPVYLAFYYYAGKEDMDGIVKSPEFGAAMQEMQGTWKDGGMDLKWAVTYENLKSFKR